MSIFLIDYENVRTSAFSGLEDLTEEDRVIVFYTSNSDNLTFSLMQRLVKARARIDYLKVSCGGKNSLDFQLCSYLGFLIGTNRDTRFCIISRDKGFSTMLSLWGENTENGNSVICCTNIYNGNGSKPIEEGETVEVREAQEEAAPAFIPEAQPEAAVEQPAGEGPAPLPPVELTEEKPLENAEVKPVEAAEETPEEKTEEKAEDKAEEKTEEKAEEKTEKKPKRQYKRRTYNRKPKAPATEQSA